MKKLISLILALVMMLGVAFTLASCGEDPPPEVPDTPDVPSTPVDPDKPDEPAKPDAPVEVPKDYAWTKADNKQINMKINLVSAAFVNLSLRYIAGADETATAKVDEDIAIRNQNAKDVTMVGVNYTYWEDADPKGGWGKSQQTIEADKNSFDPASSPDVYITAIYDSVWATFSNSLANIVGTKRDNGKNYFTFLEDDYDASKDDRGYNYDLMRSFSPLPDDVMYMVSSDYTIDVFRALHAMPVSITMMEKIDVANATGAQYNVPNFDYNEDGSFTVDELYEFVMKGKWTWDVMAALCAVVYVPSGNGESEESFGDSQLGFCMDTWGGSTVNAITYSTPFAHYTKTYDANGVPTYTQNDVKPFEPLAEALAKLFAVKGVMMLRSSKDVSDYTALSVPEGVSLPNVAIAEKFGRNEILFAEFSLIGAIEQSFFQEMEGTFSIVPIPLVEAGDENTKYTTAIGNAARVAVIGVNTDDFMEATAYLDYQSTHSSDILRAYFRSQAYESTNGEDYNVLMLEYLRTILVDQEAHIMNIHCANYLTYIYSFAPDIMAEYFTLDPNEYDFSGTPSKPNTYAGITESWYQADIVSSLQVYYSRQFMNTINTMYKVVVDKYLADKDKL